MIFALHGFLGSSKEWAELKRLVPAKSWITPSLFEDFKWPPTITFESMVDSLRTQYFSTGKDIFLGYSLGGRIGLHWMDMYPNDFKKWFFISTNPGLNSIEEKEQRYQLDVQWADRLKNLEQVDFLKLWNAQSIFSGTKESSAQHLKWNKKILEDTLLNLSLARQKNFSDILFLNKEKVQWIVGEQDQKYFQLALQLKEGKKIQTFHALAGGHRIYLDQPKPLADLIHQHLD